MASPNIWRCDCSPGHLHERGHGCATQTIINGAKYSEMLLGRHNFARTTQTILVSVKLRGFGFSLALVPSLVGTGQNPGNPPAMPRIQHFNSELDVRNQPCYHMCLPATLYFCAERTFGNPHMLKSINLQSSSCTLRPTAEKQSFGCFRIFLNKLIT